MTTTWITNLTDTGIKTDLQNLTADGTFSYADAVKLLDDVAARGAVTTAELNDLDTIASNMEVQNGISSSTYVTSLFYQLVEGSQANASWNGGTAAATPLGDLAAGSSSAQLSELIEKWFLGTDRPDPTASSDSTQPTVTPVYSSYSKYSLFGTSGTPQVTDVAQGYDGDCELCSGMIEVLQNHANLINSMFVSDGNGVYGVRFYVDGKETWVTVDSQLPTYQGQLLYNDPLLSGGNDGLWASLIEKAYAQLSADGLIGHPSTNSYDNIAADTAFNVLTNLTNTSSVEYLLSSSANWTSYKNIIIEAVQAGDDVILETGTATNDYTTNAAGQKLLVADHAFAVVGYDSATGDFIVRNPWGVEPYDSSYVTQFEVSMANVVSVGGDFAFDNSAAPNVVFNFAEQIAGLASSTNAGFAVAQPNVGANTSLRLASMVQAMDTAGLAITEYKIELLGGTASLLLNGATNLASAAQSAANEVVVSAADFGKLTINTGTSGGDIDLFVSGNDGTGWASPTELYLNVDSAQLSVLPAVDTIVAPHEAVSIAKLFSVSSSVTTSNLTYFVQIESGGGAINLNGATDLLGGGGGGQIEVSASDLAKLTYTASSASGIAVLDVTAASNGATSDVTQVPVDVGYSVAAALSTFDQGATPYQVAVSDSAATIFASLDQLEQMMPSWSLLGITLTDSSTPTETITPTQLAADRGVLSIIESNLLLDVTASRASQAIDGVSNLATVVVFSGTASQYTLSAPGNGVVDVAGASGTTAISDVVALQFSDRTLTITANNSVAEEVALLYQGALGRSPDPTGLLGWIKLASALPSSEQGMGAYALSDVSANYNGTLSIAAGFTNSAEFEAKYGSLTNAQFVTQLYANILDRAPDSGGYATWIGELSAGQSREHVLVGFADSAEAISNATNGFTGQSGTHVAWLFLT